MNYSMKKDGDQTAWITAYTMEDCLSHCRLECLGATYTRVIGNMSIGSCQTSDSDAVSNKVRFIKRSQY